MNGRGTPNSCELIYRIDLAAVNEKLEYVVRGHERTESKQIADGSEIRTLAPGLKTGNSAGARRLHEQGIQPRGRSSSKGASRASDLPSNVLSKLVADQLTTLTHGAGVLWRRLRTLMRESHTGNRPQETERAWLRGSTPGG